jgi:hypothetical protein
MTVTIDLDFSYALRAMKAGLRATRTGWISGTYVALAFGDARLTLPYFYLVTPNGQSMPWSPSHTDLLIEDWSVV